jgi:hypothetical protein
MKKLLSLALVMGLAFSVLAQRPSFKKNDIVGNATIGFGRTVYIGDEYKTTVPAIAMSGEVGFMDNFLNDAVIGVGGYVGYSAFKTAFQTGGVTYGYKYSDLILAARGTFHYPFVDNLDTYAGILIGFEFVSSRYYDDYDGTEIPGSSDIGNPLAWSTFVGARYYFNKNLSACAEVGYGIAFINLGVGYKF